MATELIVGRNDAIQGVKTFFGMNFLAPSVVVTTGTFMNGTIWVGRKSMSAGRAGEGASVVSHLLFSPSLVELLELCIAFLGGDIMNGTIWVGGYPCLAGGLGEEASMVTHLFFFPPTLLRLHELCMACIPSAGIIWVCASRCREEGRESERHW
jgi:hypothetical protein